MDTPFGVNQIHTVLCGTHRKVAFKDFCKKKSTQLAISKCLIRSLLNFPRWVPHTHNAACIWFTRSFIDSCLSSIKSHVQNSRRSNISNLGAIIEFARPLISEFRNRSR